ncbi:hypothetical protein D9E67_24555 [Escherichia coli]|nr:hypothetical protein [Escherichia coli]
MVRKQEEGDRLRYKKSGLLFMAALRVSNQAKEKKQKSPHQRAFISLRSRGSFAYPFMSPHRLVGVLLRLLTSCFCWRCPYTVQS